MILKKSKEEVLREITESARAAVSHKYYEFNPTLHVNTQVNTSNLAYMLQEAVAAAITDGFRILLESRYTDDNFESDMNLKG